MLGFGRDDYRLLLIFGLMRGLGGDAGSSPA